MSPILRFFILSPRDLNMQTLSASEIAKYMEKSDSQPTILPTKFATTLSDILEKERGVTQKKAKRDDLLNA